MSDLSVFSILGNFSKPVKRYFQKIYFLLCDLIVLYILFCKEVFYPMTNSNYLTTREVARLCKVSDATVKRWEDSGLIKSERTSGGHRRFRADEIARFQKDQKLGLKLAPGEESVNTILFRKKENREHSDSSLYHSLVGGREEEASDILINEYLSGKPLPQIFDEQISATMNRIGELWAQGELTVAQEHLATRTATNAIYKLRNVMPVSELTGKFAMCCVIEGDFHELSATLAQIALESQGVEVINFGANTPLYSFAEEVLHYSPALVCISATIMYNLERTLRDYNDFRTRTARLRPVTVLGGHAFDDEKIRYRFPADAYPQTYSELASIAKAVVNKAA